MNILFVCSANVSRSFLAENLLKLELEKANINDISVASAGLNTFDLNEPDRKMVAHLSKIGIPKVDHKPKQISKQHVDWANIILVMTTDHAKKVMDLWPEAKPKLQVFGRFVSAGPIIDDVIDPFGKSSYHYRLAQSQISLAVKNLVEILLKYKNSHQILQSLSLCAVGLGPRCLIAKITKYVRGCVSL